jgi:hypothetical protein
MSKTLNAERTPAVAGAAICSASGRRADDTGVPRKYFEAADNPMFSQVQRACVRFVQYKESVPCVLCGRRSKYHWTCVVRFKAANINDHAFALKLSKNWFVAGAPVCRDHPTQPDEAEFMRKVRAAQRKPNVQSSGTRDQPASTAKRNWTGHPALPAAIC